MRLAGSGGREPGRQGGGRWVGDGMGQGGGFVKQELFSVSGGTSCCFALRWGCCEHERWTEI